jgi:small subunit ribosomal protein S7
MMPRKGPAQRRELLPDPVYSSILVTQIQNRVLVRGKRGLAESVVYDALKIVGDRTGKDPLQILKKAIDNIKPLLEVRSRRVGGSTYQVPVEVDSRRGTTLAIRWLVTFSRRRRERSMAQRLAAEILDASGGAGAAVKRREDMHKMAEANKAFAHYRW